MFKNIDNLKYLLESQKDLIGGKGKKRINPQYNGRTRNPFQRDYSRIMYSSSFRRLQGKMQLMKVDENQFNRNRLTHSLEVSQIARSIAELLENKIEVKNLDYTVYSKNSIYVVEAGALAHDIGNSPFGHHGEKILGTLMKSYGGYEGNAQSLRTLMNIEKKYPNDPGLNLTIRILLSIVKYNKINDGNIKKYLYKYEYDVLMNFLKDNKLEETPRTIDVQIVDAADEIAYCAHDLEDALSQNYFSIDEFLFDLRQHSTLNDGDDDHPYEDEIHLFEEWVRIAKSVAEKSRVYNSSEEYSFVFRKELTSVMVNALIRDLDVLSVRDDLKPDFINTTGTNREFEIAFNHWRLVRGIKHCTFKGINRKNDVQIYEKFGTKIISGLFKALTDSEFNRDMLLMPVEYRTDKNSTEEEKMRKVADYIGGMMDPSAIEIYSKIYGGDEVSKLYSNGY